MNKHNLPEIKDLKIEELISFLKVNKFQDYRAKQIWRWIYIQQKDSFGEMMNLGKGLQELLCNNFSNNRLEISAREQSRDGTIKYLFQLQDNKYIESVLIPERDHYTLCISSQVGCALKCRFCLTGNGGLARNLTKSEIISQVRDIKNDLQKDKKLTNIVFMGMGEPLNNYRNVLEAINVLLDADSGLGFSHRKITLSTSGIIPKIKKLGNDTNVNLAISLNATSNKTRDMLMPINRRYTIEALITTLKEFPLKKYRRITIEYILIKDINDSPEDAKRLAKLLRPIKTKINLLPFNEHHGSPFKRPSLDAISIFQKELIKNRYTAIIRKSKGSDISAACGQLRAKQIKDGAE